MSCDLTYTVDRYNCYVTFRMLLNYIDYQKIQLGTKHLINGELLEVVMIPLIELKPPQQFEVFVIFKKQDETANRR